MIICSCNVIRDEDWKKAVKAVCRSDVRGPAKIAESAFEFLHKRPRCGQCFRDLTKQAQIIAQHS